MSGCSGSVISARATYSVLRQRRRAEALPVGRELVHGGIEDARLHAAVAQRACARRRGASRPRAGSASRNRWSAPRPRRRRGRSRRARPQPLPVGAGELAAAARRRAASLRQAREQQRRARLVQAVVEAHPDRVVGLRLARVAAPGAATSCPGCAGCGRARRRRRRRWPAARPRRTASTLLEKKLNAPARPNVPSARPSTVGARGVGDVLDQREPVRVGERAQRVTAAG